MAKGHSMRKVEMLILDEAKAPMLQECYQNFRAFVIEKAKGHKIDPHLLLLLVFKHMAETFTDGSE